MVVEKAASKPRVLPRYARLLGVSQGRAQREAATAARACLAAMRFRFPEALYLVELVIRLGDVGAFDLVGSVRQIGERIGELLGEPPPDSVRLQRAMRAVAGRTCSVERQSRQLWRLCLAGLCDPTTLRHRSLLAETPSPYRLEASAEPSFEMAESNERTAVAALPGQLDAMTAKRRAVETERDAATVERDDLARRVRALETELANVGDQRDDLARQLQDARMELDLERRELGRIREQDARDNKTIGALRAALTAQAEELQQEHERRRLAEAALVARPERVALVVEQVTRAGVVVAEQRRLEDLLLDREVELEDARRELAGLQAALVEKDSAAREQQLAAEVARRDEAAKSAGLRGLLNEERERRRSVETRLRRLQVALRIKLESREELAEVDLARDEVILAGIRRVLEEHTLAQRSEHEALSREAGPDLERLEDLDQDVQMGQILGRLLARAVLDVSEGRGP